MCDIVAALDPENIVAFDRIYFLYAFLKKDT
jgi:hypothetical protein